MNDFMAALNPAHRTSLDLMLRSRCPGRGWLKAKQSPVREILKYTSVGISTIGAGQASSVARVTSREDFFHVPTQITISCPFDDHTRQHVNAVAVHFNVNRPVAMREWKAPGTPVISETRSSPSRR